MLDLQLKCTHKKEAQTLYGNSWKERIYFNDGSTFLVGV